MGNQLDIPDKHIDKASLLAEHQNESPFTLKAMESGTGITKYGRPTVSAFRKHIADIMGDGLVSAIRTGGAVNVPGAGASRTHYAVSPGVGTYTAPALIAWEEKQSGEAMRDYYHRHPGHTMVRFPATAAIREQFPNGGGTHVEVGLASQDAHVLGLLSDYENAGEKVHMHAPRVLVGHAVQALKEFKSMAPEVLELSKVEQAAVEKSYYRTDTGLETKVDSDGLMKAEAAGNVLTKVVGGLSTAVGWVAKVATMFGVEIGPLDIIPAEVSSWSDAISSASGWASSMIQKLMSFGTDIYEGVAHIGALLKDSPLGLLSKPFAVFGDTLFNLFNGLGRVNIFEAMANGLRGNMLVKIGDHNLYVPNAEYDQVIRTMHAVVSAHAWLRQSSDDVRHTILTASDFLAGQRRTSEYGLLNPQCPISHVGMYAVPEKVTTPINLAFQHFNTDVIEPPTFDLNLANTLEPSSATSWTTIDMPPFIATLSPEEAARAEMFKIKFNYKARSSRGSASVAMRLVVREATWNDNANIYKSNPIEVVHFHQAIGAWSQGEFTLKGLIPQSVWGVSNSFKFSLQFRMFKNTSAGIVPYNGLNYNYQAEFEGFRLAVVGAKLVYAANHAVAGPTHIPLTEDEYWAAGDIEGATIQDFIMVCGSHDPHPSNLVNLWHKSFETEAGRRLDRLMRESVAAFNSYEMAQISPLSRLLERTHPMCAPLYRRIDACQRHIYQRDAPRADGTILGADEVPAAAVIIDTGVPGLELKTKNQLLKAIKRLTKMIDYQREWATQLIYYISHSDSMSDLFETAIGTLGSAFAIMKGTAVIDHVNVNVCPRLPSRGTELSGSCGWVKDPLSMKTFAVNEETGFEEEYNDGPEPTVEVRDRQLYKLSKKKRASKPDAARKWVQPETVWVPVDEGSDEADFGVLARTVDGKFESFVKIAGKIVLDDSATSKMFGATMMDEGYASDDKEIVSSWKQKMVEMGGEYFQETGDEMPAFDADLPVDETDGIEDLIGLATELPLKDILTGVRKLFKRTKVSKLVKSSTTFIEERIVPAVQMAARAASIFVGNEDPGLVSGRVDALQTRIDEILTRSDEMAERNDRIVEEFSRRMGAIETALREAAAAGSIAPSVIGDPEAQESDDEIISAPEDVSDEAEWTDEDDLLEMMGPLSTGVTPPPVIAADDMP